MDEETNDITQMTVSPLVIRNYPHDTALTSVFKVLGDPYNSNIFPCDEELRWEISGLSLLSFCQNERFLSFLSLYTF